MWFPYTLPAQWKTECDRERVHDSEADSSLREFLVGFYLRNPISQESQVELHLEEPQWIDFEHKDGHISAGFYPHDEERLAEILCRIQEHDPVSAVECCYTFVNRLLNFWSAWYGRGFGIDGFRVADLRHEARWRAVSHRPSSELFTLPEIEGSDEQMDRLFDLYRTVRTSNNPEHRFLCAYKLIRLICNSEIDSADLHELVESEMVTRETMVISGLIKYRPELEGKQITELPGLFHDWHEWLVGRVTETETTSQPLNFVQLDELNCISNLLDISCHKVLGQVAGKLAAREMGHEAAE